MSLFQLYPYFVQPTFLDSTAIQCLVNEHCYLNLWAKTNWEKINGEDKHNQQRYFEMKMTLFYNHILILNIHLHFSPILNADKTIDDGVYVFPLKDNVSQPCQFDVSILKNNTTDFDLCFVLFADTSQVYM